MKKGKFRKISKAMHVEDPENAAKIIAEQAGKLDAPQPPKETGDYDFDAEMLKSKPQDDIRKRAQKEKMEYDTYNLDNILAKYDEPRGSQLRESIKRDLESFEGGNTYIGENFHKPVWQKPSKDYPQPIPVPEEYLDRIGNHVGKNIMYGGNDPFQWIDSKYGASKAWLEKTTGQPRTIETQSDLIAHDDYMDKLTPKDKVVFHILGDDNRISRVLMPGAPSQARVIKAAKKLADSGVNVTIKRHNIPGRKPDKSSQIIPDGIWLQDEALRLDPEQIKSIAKTTGVDFFDSPVMDADAAPLIQQGKDMAKKEFDEIYRYRPSESPKPVVEPPKGPKDPRLTKDSYNAIDKEVDQLTSEIDQLNPSDPDYNIMLNKRIARLEELGAVVDKSIEAKKPRVIKTDSPKGPKGDPEASLPRQPDKFASIRSQLDVAPSRMDERGKAFGDVGQSDFTPYDTPSPQFEEIQKRNYVERDADPKEKLWKEIVANDPYLPDSPEYLQNLRNYFDNRWEQAQGTAEGGQMRMDLPKADRVKPGADLGVTSRYVDELAFKKFAKTYEKTRQSERPILGPNDRTHKIDDKITDHFEGYEVQTPGRKLQNEMYKGRPSHEAEQAKLFPKVKEAVKGKADEAIPKPSAKPEAFTPVKGQFKTSQSIRGGAPFKKGSIIVHDGDMYKVTNHWGDDFYIESIPYNEDLLDEASSLGDDVRNFELYD
jgi:hypothetical protein